MKKHLLLLGLATMLGANPSSGTNNNVVNTAVPSLGHIDSLGKKATDPAKFASTPGSSNNTQAPLGAGNAHKPGTNNNKKPDVPFSVNFGAIAPNTGTNKNTKAPSTTGTNNNTKAPWETDAENEAGTNPWDTPGGGGKAVKKKKKFFVPVEAGDDTL